VNELSWKPDFEFLAQFRLGVTQKKNFASVTLIAGENLSALLKVD
jgi:hypothetical protein